MSDDMISRADAIAILEDEMPGHYLSKKTQIVTKLRALPAIEVGVTPECGHPFCGDRCGTATPAADVAGLVEIATKLLNAATELAQLASYSEICGGITVNRQHIRKWCDAIFDLRKALPEDENFDPSFAALARMNEATK